MWSVRSRRRELSTARRMLSGRLDTPPPSTPFSGNAKPNLVGDLDLVADGFEGFADDLFIGERAVHLGGVEEGDAEIHGVPDHGDRVLTRRAAGVAVRAGETHAAQADLRHGQAVVSESALLHVGFLSRAWSGPLW